MPGEKKPLEARFWDKVDIAAEYEACWYWTGAIDLQTGYGRIGLGGRKAGVGNAHKVSYELHYGPVPDGMEVCHRCSTRRCVHPYHLYAGTKSDNMKQAWREGTGCVPNRWQPGFRNRWGIVRQRTK